ncbi:DUF2306 domain-containing protein [Hyphomicrobium sp. 1Nfss2.1]|uniref:DUF2306 domain-containing protein n=1 Tax=Hyphomicrobium sp. 1Nfss2.1 TaxID=3413936 RepID=UPI003C7A7ACC
MSNDATTALLPGGIKSGLRLLAARAPGLAVICGVLLLALPTGLVAMSQGIGAIPLPYNLFLVDERLPGIFKLHMLASGAALLLIPAVIALRRTRAWHRPLGYAAAALVLLGAITSLPVAYYSHSVLAARLGFLAQGIVWLALIALGIAAIRRRRYGDHARLMLMMAAVASGALWVRLTTTVATGYDLPFDPVYGCAAWLGWLVPLAVVTLLPTPWVPASR